MVETGPLLVRIINIIGGWVQGSFSPAQGAYNSLWASTTQKVAESITSGDIAPNTLVSGAYYHPVVVFHRKSTFATREQGKKLWEWTEEQISEFLQ